MRAVVIGASNQIVLPLCTSWVLERTGTISGQWVVSETHKSNFWAIATECQFTIRKCSFCSPRKIINVPDSSYSTSLSPSEPSAEMLWIYTMSEK